MGRAWSILRPELERIASPGRLGARIDSAEAESMVVAAGVGNGNSEARRRRAAWSATQSALIDAIWSEVRRSAGLRRRGSGCTKSSHWPERFDLPAPEVDSLERWPGLLAAAVAAGVITPRQVVVIVGQTRAEQLPADRRSRPTSVDHYDAICQERWRAEARLAHVRSGLLLHEGGVVMTTPLA